MGIKLIKNHLSDLADYRPATAYLFRTGRISAASKPEVSNMMNIGMVEYWNGGILGLSSMSLMSLKNSTICEISTSWIEKTSTEALRSS